MYTGTNARRLKKIEHLEAQGKTLPEVIAKFSRLQPGDVLKGRKFKRKIVKIYPFHLLTERTSRDGEKIRESFAYTELYMRRKI